MMITNVELEKLNPIKEKIEENSTIINKVVNDIITPYCKDLDKYVYFIKDCLKDGERQLTNEELEDSCLNLSTYIYFASGMCEELGIRDDISKALYREVYNTARNEVEKGTVDDKNSNAELASQQELLTNICFSKAYKIVKCKVESAQELLASCKKIMNKRISELELSKLSR